MRLANGFRLGPYEIVAPRGAGGMGEVYRALDTRLDRTVAIKILPAQLSADVTRRQRFEREARFRDGKSVLFSRNEAGKGIRFYVQQVDGSAARPVDSRRHP